MKYVVKLFPEITIKSRPVRKQLIKQLKANLRTVLKRIDPELKVSGQWDNVQVETASEDSAVVQQVTAALASTPGIAYFMSVQKYPYVDFDDTLEKAKALFADKIKGKTLCVRIKRAGNHDFKSVDAERYIGGCLRQQCEAKGIDLKNPEIQINLEIRDQDLYLVHERYEGLGGYPIGSQDSVLSLMSGGFDSTVASYLMMRRGIQTHFCFFNLGGRAHELGVKEVSHYIWEKFGSSHGVKFVSVPFEGVVAEILQNVERSYMGVILKRMMLRAASKVAEKMKLDTLVTGESIAQVSSQTLKNLSAIDQVTDTLVLRPLVTTHKQEIVDIASQIGTYEFAAHMPEYCGVISDKPTTRASMERVHKAEEGFDFGVLEQALEDMMIQKIQNVVDDFKQDVQVEEVSEPETTSSVIVDIRHPDEEEQAPLAIDGVAIEKIPFYALHSAFKEKSLETEYLLYCDRGVMSQLHAQQLQADGYTNVKVYKKSE
ncbi:tRNA uracil 4-sulfurtransferase ThiI [Litoribacillus peritrichatus]|uniref:tRNA sulfurtransferase n=1 Tax=Litoribacillus peritrichatus TaxID=718191 RepID=A0ABP7MTA2_9GAMM